MSSKPSLSKSPKSPDWLKPLGKLGETDLAIAALQEAVGAGWLVGWWGLNSGDFDPAFAGVTADPRFIEVFTEIENRVSRMRADFLAHPELPENPKNYGQAGTDPN